MSITSVTVTAAEVGCDNCEETIVLPHWRDAAEHGWCVPSDGHLQLCPACLADHKQAMAIAANAPNN